MATASDIQGVISSRITSLTSVADTAFTELNTLLADIQTAAMGGATMNVAPPVFDTYSGSLIGTPPAVPTLDIQFPSDPTIEAIQDFSEVAPIDTTTAPTNSFKFTETGYNPVTLPSLKNDDVEKDIFDLGDKLEDLARREAIIEARGRWAERGFDLTGGPLLKEIRDINLKYAAGRLAKSKAGAFRSAELVLDQKKENITTSLTNERELLNHFEGVAQRALKTAQIAAQLGIEIFHAVTTRTKTVNSLRATNADVYVETIKGKQLDAEIYKAKVYAYSEQLKGLIDVYNSMVEAYNVDIDKSKSEADLKVYQQNIQWIQDDMDIKTTLANGRQSLKLFIEFMKIQTGADFAAAKLLTQKASAALQAFNVINHVVVTAEKQRQQ